MVERMGWGLVLVVSGALVSLGCGGVEDGERNANDGIATAGSENLICKGTGWQSTRVVAAAFSGNDLVFLQADGTRQTKHSFPVPAGTAPGNVFRSIRTGATTLTASLWSQNGTVGSPVQAESVRVRRTGELVWRLEGIASGASDAGMGTWVNGVPKLVRANGTTSDVPVTDWDFFEFTGDPDDDGWIGANWTSYPSGREYRGRVNLDGVRYENARPPVREKAEAPEWTLELENDVPAWVVHTPTGERAPVRLDRLAPLRPLEGAFCNEPTLLPDGRIGFGMRDEASAGFFVGRADGTGWERVGEALRNVTSIIGHRVGTTWVVRATDGFNTYCPQFEPFLSADATAPAGDTLQLVAPDQEPFVFGGVSWWNTDYLVLDATGTCAFERGDDVRGAPRFIDLTTRVSTKMPGLESFIWL